MTTSLTTRKERYNVTTVQTSAERSVRNGDLSDALAHLQEDVRVHPDDPKLRIFLFQLLCVAGQWTRAINQLGAVAAMDPAAIEMAHIYGDAAACEMIRADVFAGRTSPMVLGDPEPWLAPLIESLLLAGRGEHGASEQRRVRAFDEAPPSSGHIDARPFQWIADADSRLGPVLEAIVNGHYYWVPFARLRRIAIDPPADLRDIVWISAHLQFDTGDEAMALIPARYPGSEAAESSIALARQTVWTEVRSAVYHGLGQRILITDAHEAALLQIRSIELTDGQADATDDSRPGL